MLAGEAISLFNGGDRIGLPTRDFVEADAVTQSVVTSSL